MRIGFDKRVEVTVLKLEPETRNCPRAFTIAGAIIYF